MPPKLTLASDTTLGAKIGRVMWSGSDASGIARYRLQRRIDGGRWRDVELADASATRADVSVGSGHRYRFRVRAKDETGVWSDWATGPEVTARILQTDASTVRFNGRWRIDEDRSASGSWTRYTRSDGARAAFTFTGRSFAYVAPTGPAEAACASPSGISVVATIDLRSAEIRPRRVVFTRSWPTAGRHTVRIEAMGDDRVDIDAFVVLR